MAVAHKSTPDQGYAADRGPDVAVVNPTDLSRTSWGAIFAGAICGLAIYLILGMIGLAAGIGVIDPAEDAAPLAGVPTGLGLWWVISALVAFFAAGLIAGRLAGWPRDTTGALHGLTVGAMTLLFVAYVATSTIGATISGAAGAVTSMFGSSERQNVLIRVKQPQWSISHGGSDGINRSQVSRSRTISTDSGGDNFVAGLLLQEAMSSIRQEGRELFSRLVSDAEQRRVGNKLEATYADLLETPGDAGRDIEELFNFLLSNDGVLGPQDRQRARRVLINRLGVEKGEADKILDRWQSRYEEAINNLQNVVNSAGRQLSRYAGQQGARLEDLAGEATSERRKSEGAGESAGEGENINDATKAVREGARDAADAIEAQAANASEAIRHVADRSQSERTARIAQAAYRDIVNSSRDALSDLQLMFDRLFGQGGVWTETDLQELRTLLGEKTGLREENVNRLIERWQTRYREAVVRAQAAYQTAKREVAEVSNATLDTMAATAGWTSLALILALAAATIGGMLGRPGQEDTAAFALAGRSDRRDDDHDAE